MEGATAPPVSLVPHTGRSFFHGSMWLPDLFHMSPSPLTPHLFCGTLRSCVSMHSSAFCWNRDGHLTYRVFVHLCVPYFAWLGPRGPQFGTPNNRPMKSDKPMIRRICNHLPVFQKMTSSPMKSYRRPHKFRKWGPLEGPNLRLRITDP